MSKKHLPSAAGIESHFLVELYEKLLDLKEKMVLGIDASEENSSLRNMHHYLNLRKYDFSQLQDDLTKAGLSSFGRSQAHMEASVNVALEILSLAIGKECVHHEGALSYDASHAIMEQNAKIFSSSDDKTKIMITAPSAYKEDWFEKLAYEGVHLFRINTAHDDPEVWSDMAHHIDKISDKEVKIYVDLAGPKIRTDLKRNKIKVFCDDSVMIHTADFTPSKKVEKKYDAIVGCSLEHIGTLVSVGDPVFIDDGKIELEIVEIIDENIVCKVITHNEEGSKIKDEKGINFPKSDIAIHAICVHDKIALQHIVDYADIIGISFAQSAEDIADLINELEQLGKKGEIAIVAKIETQKGVKNLPSILKELIRYGKSGIMIARGDLAIETGFENLALMQEEILDLCTAAHMPVILATQILENKMKTNTPSRAEISDVAFAHKAECVMLNKGEYELETIKIIKTIFAQMDLIWRKNKLLYNHSFQWK